MGGTPLARALLGEKAPLVEAEVVETLPTLSSIPKLHNDFDPAYEVQTEKPWHRTCAYKLLSGASPTECAEEFGCNVKTVYNLQKQSWFKSHLAQLSQANFGDSVQGLLKGAAIEAVGTLSDLAQNGTTEAVRARSASELLKSFLANVPDEAPADTTPEEEMKQIKADIKRLKTAEEQ